MSRPEWIKDEHLEYLDKLRESGETNMFGAGAWLMDKFGLSRNESTTALKCWMKTFGKDDR